MCSDRPRETLLGGPTPEAKGLQAEDNYTIEVWNREGGELIGICLRTSLWIIQCQAWPEAIKAYPGRYLIRKNAHFVISAAKVPTDDDVGSGPGRDTSYKSIALEDLPQWYGIEARCSCGRSRKLDRYAPPVAKWKSFSLALIEEKLTCTLCEEAGRANPKIELELVKLPR
ncbi:hypothetical protein [Shinella sp. BYT-45]|uniref:hypothetical protein n=1 Tax=Shinella sp. BYT-45 TaxID=3377377 RepID=UPI00398081E7